ncbi:uncharacterized protein LOC132555325 [Ylistrum balloti]|uniref:uncharacterized protein LOC132555325 n=1 Tax=Ylistrum balloti TaxID=509963 RepID=UPI002905C12C|nr:uncharacterized protein LOC132555325 [Ylistrum balloti]
MTGVSVAAVSLVAVVYSMLVPVAEFAAVPPPACCPLEDKNETGVHPDVTSQEAEWKQRLHSFENSLLMSVERRSLAFAALLMAVSMAILLIGTCILSCRSEEAGCQYEPLSQEDWDTLTSSLLRNANHVDLKTHLYPAPFREQPEM